MNKHIQYVVYVQYDTWVGPSMEKITSLMSSTFCQSSLFSALSLHCSHRTFTWHQLDFSILLHQKLAICYFFFLLIQPFHLACFHLSVLLPIHLTYCPLIFRSVCPPKYKPWVNLSPSILAWARANRLLVLLEIHCLQTHNLVMFLKFFSSFPFLYLNLVYLGFLFF